MADSNITKKAILCAVERWLLNNEFMHVDEFLDKILVIVRTSIMLIQKEMDM